jgi:hypothetical protein
VRCLDAAGALLTLSRSLPRVYSISAIIKLVDFSKLLDLVKSARFGVIVATVTAVTAFLLFAPKPWLEFLSVQSLVDSNRGVIGLIFISAGFTAVVNLAFEVGAKSSQWLSRLQITRSKSQRLHNLTDAEKDLLNTYIMANTRTQIFKDNDGVAMGLRRDKVIYLASTTGTYLGFPFNIENWAWQYLKGHPELLRRHGPPTSYARASTDSIPKIIG